MGTKIRIEQGKDMNASTDMGNVSHRVPSVHGAFVIPATADVSAHNPAFTACARTDEAHKAALTCTKGMAMLALRVFIDDEIANQARFDFG